MNLTSYQLLHRAIMYGKDLHLSLAHLFRPYERRFQGVPILHRFIVVPLRIKRLPIPPHTHEDKQLDFHLPARLLFFRLQLFILKYAPFELNKVYTLIRRALKTVEDKAHIGMMIRDSS